MALTRDQILDIAHLARLNLSEEELERFRPQLEAILGYVESLNSLDLASVEPTTHVLSVPERLRSDNLEAGLTPEEATANAPESKAGHVKVPRILEE
jgi:aspartyl-tRNA(Asn)/glutamyl-tRNA(Gln) amidotransferase subunit C